MKTVTVEHTSLEPKKHSIRMQTAERLGGQHPLSDVYVPRIVLTELGLSEKEQNDPLLKINVTYSVEE